MRIDTPPPVSYPQLVLARSPGPPRRAVLFVRCNKPSTAKGNAMTSDITLGVTLLGQGSEHVVVLHDWNGDHTNYDSILDYLDGASFTYAFVDLRGYGK